MKQKLLGMLIGCLFLGGPIINTYQLTQPCYAAIKSKKTKLMRTPINWQKSSEYSPYPDLKKYHHINIYVSLKKQRVYIRNNNKVLYTMYASTGAKGDQATPTGTYHIQPERGHFFYNAQSKEGAFYWVSWKGHGIYLFHTVPTDANGNFIKKEADKLGKKASSHGCIRLAVPDAKWLYENIPEGTKVTISKN